MPVWLDLIPRITNVAGPNEACPPKRCFYRVAGNALLLLHRPFLYLRNFCPPYDEIGILPEHEPGTANEEFHRWYLRLFDPSYENFPKRGSALTIADADRERVSTLNRLSRLIGELPESMIVDNDLGELADQIDTVIANNEYLKRDGAFVSCQGSSTKRQRGPVFDGTRAIRELCRSESLSSVFLDTRRVPELSLLLTPWNYKLESSPEYRIFVYDGIVKTVCRKRYLELCDRSSLSTSALTALEVAINKFQISYVGSQRLRHKCCAVDAYLHDGELRSIKVHPWYNSSTGLFDYRQIVNTPTNVCHYAIYAISK